MNNGNNHQIDFNVNKSDLYREVMFTDLRAASVRKLVPILEDGTDDPKRDVIFIGATQLMTPEGPLPIQTKLKATTLKQALDEFPYAMKLALSEVVEEIQKMQQEQKRQSKDDSRIIIPGR